MWLKKEKNKFKTTSYTKLELISKVFNQPIENFIPSSQTVNQVSHGNGSNIGKIETQNNYSESNLAEIIKEALTKLDVLISNNDSNNIP